MNSNTVTNSPPAQESSPLQATGLNLPPGQAPEGAGSSFYPTLLLWLLWMAFLLAMMFLRVRSTSV